MKKSHTVHFTLDLENSPPLTAKQRAMLAALEAMPDEEIDLSEMPEVDFSLYHPARERKKAAPV